MNRPNSRVRLACFALAVVLVGCSSRESSSPLAPRIDGPSAPSAFSAPEGPVLAGALTITEDSLPNGNVGAEYTAFLSGEGGSGEGPLLFKVVDGKLPRGLRLERSFGVQSALIHGVPTRVGTSTFTVQVKDGDRNTATKTFTITIDPPTPVEITNPQSELRQGTVGEPYAANLFANGGVQPYAFTIVAGALPPGLELDGNVIQGTPTTAGTFAFTAQVTDDVGQSDTMDFTITVL